MKPRSMTLMVLLRRGAFAGCVPLAVVYLLGAAAAAQQPAALAAPAPSAAQAPGRGRGPQPVDPRVQIRMHRFAEMNEDIPYALFVSSKVRKDKKAPMIVTLHGIGGTHTTMMRPNAIDLAEAGGYILLAPMGYNPRGWYGAPDSARSIAFGRIIVVCVPPIPCRVTINGAFLSFFTFDDTNSAYGMSSFVSAK